MSLSPNVETIWRYILTRVSVPRAYAYGLEALHCKRYFSGFIVIYPVENTRVRTKSKSKRNNS